MRISLRRKRRCLSRLRKGEDPKFHGRCELPEGHYTESGEDDHMLVREGVNVRWTERKAIRYEQT